MSEANQEKLKALQMTMERLDKAYGKGTVMRLGDDSKQDIEVISTGSISLDLALGIKGLPKGRIVEIFGAESAGKTTLALSAVSQTQKQGGNAAYIDVEHALDLSLIHISEPTRPY